MFTLIVSTADYSNTPLWNEITIKGSAADQFSIRKVRVYIYRKSDSALVYTSPDDASIGTNSFSVTLDPAEYGNLGNLAPEKTRTLPSRHGTAQATKIPGSICPA